MLYPDSILVGQSDDKAGDMLATIYLQMCEKKPPVQRMNWVSAELTKISVNTYVTTKISYANMLADICDRLPGADVDVVTKALGADTRIGAKYLKGAMGYGGPCFPRDNVAFAALARKLGARADVAEATDRINNYQIERLSGLVAKFAKAGTRIALLGLSYKPQTPVVEESHSVKLAAKLADAGYIVAVHDPFSAGFGDRRAGREGRRGVLHRERGARLRPADRRNRLARVQGDRPRLVQARRPTAHHPRSMAHADRREIRGGRRCHLSGAGAVALPTAERAAAWSKTNTSSCTPSRTACGGTAASGRS